jgi:ParB/RepB/Spo0J family partition protein
MPVKKSDVLEFDATRVRPLPNQPRKRFSGIKELAASIAEIGQSTPGIVTLIEGDADYDCQLVDGERRLRACVVAGVAFRAEVRRGGTVDEIFAASFAANFGKQDHDCVEIAEGLDRMHRSGKTVEQMARIAGKSECWVYQHLSLMKLHADVRAMLIPGENGEAPLNYQIALLLVPVEQEDQQRLAKKIVKFEMSVASARRLVLRERHESGDDKAYINNNGPKRSLASLDSILADFGDRMGVFLDMPGSDFNRLVDSISARDRRLLIESLEETAGNLTTMADAITRRLPKLAHRAVA